MSRLLDLRKTPGAGRLPGALGCVAYGHGVQLAGADVSVGLKVFGAEAEAHAWLAEGPFTEGTLDGLHYRHNKDFLFGWISLGEQACRPGADMSPLETVSRQAYDAVFAVQAQTGFTHLLRCWNYLPGINIDGGGLERYRQFNIGRQDAFIAARQAWLDGSPSACALGSAEGELVVYFLAGRHSALPIENPRQTSAYRYPAQYGPRAPTFSRASLLRLESEEVLFISGTASIVGHESLHLGNVREQTRETLRNLDAVVAEANRHAFFGRFETRKLFLKVYLRHAEDLPVIRETLQHALGEGLNVSFLLADVCRAELLVEIEAFGFLDAEPAC
ncbi:hypothetical protein ACFONG_09470 [Uliginosibacterium paludis]|uniref:Chorismatase FkbO/Hyg5-like N-terminal domain-containing protein n=1 Tax=Uliginosibacterium paludis TaxID=1615952 RepID=A0ABV2CP72_9RHOO